jgi:hypothetical protein
MLYPVLYPAAARVATGAASVCGPALVKALDGLSKRLFPARFVKRLDAPLRDQPPDYEFQGNPSRRKVDVLDVFPMFGLGVDVKVRQRIGVVLLRLVSKVLPAKQPGLLCVIVELVAIDVVEGCDVIVLDLNLLLD